MRLRGIHKNKKKTDVGENYTGLSSKTTKSCVLLSSETNAITSINYIRLKLKPTHFGWKALEKLLLVLQRRLLSDVGEMGE